jgi:putative protease
MVAAINAGADAVYMGGSRFGARAYADNPAEDGFLQAIDYVHLHGRRLYMTVNTLVKEEEMEQLPDFLDPYYRRGLDAAIVQDLGVLSLIRERFPKLPVHISTQATVTGRWSARLFKELGAARVVTARELSLEEIAGIRDEVDLEIESFVHGALCYCYSGQCLLSSLIGGRSGNRGRCAQPCRLPYTVEEAGTGRHPGRRKARQSDVGRKNGHADGEYLLNLKDLCTLDLLPDIVEAGVFSLKIEGRMKSPRYTAGVVSIYRKYVDQYLEKGRDGYRVDPADKQMLLELFDRGGFTDGYYRQQNGRRMLSLGKRPGFREVDQELYEYLDQKYVNAKLQEPVDAVLTVREGETMSLTLHMSGNSGKEPAFGVTGGVVQKAQNQPMTEERLRRQMNKTGESPFFFRQLRVELEGACFVPVQELNDLRRRGLEELERRILEEYRREVPREASGKRESGSAESGKQEPGSAGSGKQGHGSEEPGKREHDGGESESIGIGGTWETGEIKLHASLEDPGGLAVVAAHPDISEIYLDCCGFSHRDWQSAVRACHEAGKKCALILPHIFRKKAEQYFREHREELKDSGFDELVLRSLEEIVFLREQGIELPMVLDANLYGMNQRACEVMKKAGAARLTLPLELNRQELERLGCQGKELVGYGHLPAMVSAQCVRRTLTGCIKEPEVLFLRDRTGKRLPVKNHCRFCYNTVYNPDPLSLLGLERQVRQLAPSVLRLAFTIEGRQKMQQVLDAYGDHFRRGKNDTVPAGEFTRGHFKRGVE